MEDGTSPLYVASLGGYDDIIQLLPREKQTLICAERIELVHSLLLVKADIAPLHSY